jgi:hypothetical protein
MSGSEALMEKMQLRQSYRNVWHTDLTNAVTADLPCAYALAFSFWVSGMVSV